MLIPVIFFDGNHGTARTSDLEYLIRTRGIIAFKRSDKWVYTKDCRYRGLGGIYIGPDRRKNDDVLIL